MIYVVTGYEYHHCYTGYTSVMTCVNLSASLFVLWGKSYANPHSVDRAAMNN